MHTMSIYIAREQFIRHQTVECTQARSKDFHIHVVHALLHMHVFMKFKSSCTVLVNTFLVCYVIFYVYLSCIVYTVRFEQSTYNAHEYTGLVQIILLFNDLIPFPFTLQVITTDGSAIGKV